MDSLTFAAIIAASFMHAAWNAMIKIGLDRFMAMALMGLSLGGLSLMLTPFFPFPDRAAWPYMIASVIFHIAYNLSLVRAYNLGEYGQVYPLARGAAPLAVAAFGALFLGEALSPLGWGGIIVLVGGVWLMSLKGGGKSSGSIHATAVGAALVVSTFIATYTVIDGIGGRVSGTPSGYTLWLSALEGLIMLLIAAGVRGPAAILALRGVWTAGIIAGALSLGAYWIAIWAMSRAPLGTVAALRETSIFFALAISVAALKEPLTPWRATAAAMIVLGAVSLRLA
ncbi:EamA family transporter [Rhodoligotrophos defluvii]|uniref:EamA family transporter n=1 Tax=Rhodoligotrophos defluvii TaxID=2561934 RepID=UPI0010C98E38|nr:EamA family transporter [Rhodoligotrophos defluvii]